MRQTRHRGSASFCNQLCKSIFTSPCGGQYQIFGISISLVNINTKYLVKTSQIFGKTQFCCLQVRICITNVFKRIFNFSMILTWKTSTLSLYFLIKNCCFIYSKFATHSSFFKTDLFKIRYSPYKLYQLFLWVGILSVGFRIWGKLNMTWGSVKSQRRIYSSDNPPLLFFFFHCIFIILMILLITLTRLPKKNTAMKDFIPKS